MSTGEMGLQEQQDALDAAGLDSGQPQPKESEYHVGQGLTRNDEVEPAERDDDTLDPPSGDETDPGGDSFTPDVLSRAQAYGYTAEAARAMGSPEVLEQAIAQQSAAMLPQQAAGYQQQNWGQQQPASNNQQAGQQQFVDPKVDPFAVEKLQMNFDPDVTDPSVIAQFQAINDHVYAQQLAMQKNYEQQLDQNFSYLQQLSQYTTDLQSQVQNQTNQQGAKEYAESLGSLGGNYTHLFGENPSAAHPGTPAYNNMSMVVGRAEELRNQYLRMGSNPPPRAELAKTAAYMVFPQQMQQAAQQGATQGLKKQPKRRQRPTGTAKPAKGADSAAARWNAQLRSSGYDYDQE